MSLQLVKEIYTNKCHYHSLEQLERNNEINQHRIKELDHSIPNTNNEFDINQYFRMVENKRKLEDFRKLKKNWNGYSAEKIDDEIVDKCIKLITDSRLRYQPYIYPTGRNSIQFEYEKSDGSYLEIEFFKDKISLLYTDSFEFETEIGNVNLDNIIDLIDRFHGKC
ncbi:MAG: hypothetical protein GF353_28375 [Candidatus Lokiarchaeota archaeon]|nr:hypothetical protein [Candidatus Lokiarchaeota archaeon]